MSPANSILHKRNGIIHSKKRAKERYNIEIGSEIHFLNQQIKDNKAIFLYDEGKRLNSTHYLVKLGEKYLWAVWNKVTDSIHTFLPLEECLITRAFRFSNSTLGRLSLLGLINVDSSMVIKVVNHEQINVERHESLTVAR